MRRLLRRWRARGEVCGRCQRPAGRWAAPSPLWNLVMRGNDINGDALYSDMVCIPCFIWLAESSGVIPQAWRLAAYPEPHGLTKVTPSGRVWNPSTWLWGPPAPARTLTDADLTHLREVVAAVENRSWEWNTLGADGYPQQIIAQGNAALIAECYEDPDHPSAIAEFISTFDPPTVAAILARIS